MEINFHAFFLCGVMVVYIHMTGTMVYALLFLPAGSGMLTRRGENRVQRVSNCLIIDGERDEERILMIQKPRRGWWYLPGGKVDPGETVQEAAKREVEEETSLSIGLPLLRGVFTILIEENGCVKDEWMLFTFFTRRWRGAIEQGTHEGELKWVPKAEIQSLPMPEGDRMVLNKLLSSEKKVWIGRFVYTPEYQLIRYDLHEG